MKKNNLGEKIKQAVKKTGLTQNEFEDKYNISRNLISRWVNGGGTPSIKSLKKIAQASDLPLDYFLENNTSCEEKTGQTNNPSINLIMDLIKKQNQVIEENNKRIETEISFLKKEIEQFRKS